MITKFKLYENDKNDILTLYHGYEESVNFDKFKYLFLSESLDFAEEYGKYLYEVKINPRKIFDSLDKEQMKKLFDENDGEMYEPYYDKYVTFDNFDLEDTWEMIEYYGVNSFEEECIRITEGGIINYVITDPEIIIRVKELNKFRK